MLKLLMKSMLAISSLTLASVTYANSVEGTYNCKGNEIDTHAPYVCKTTLKRTGETYSLNTSCDDDTSYTGTAIYDKAKSILSIVAINPKKAEETAVITSYVKPNKLVSTWTYMNKTTLEHSFCEKEKA